LGHKLDYIFDGGVLGTDTLSKQGSTVVDLSKHGMFTIIRDGRLVIIIILITFLHSLLNVYYSTMT